MSHVVLQWAPVLFFSPLWIFIALINWSTIWRGRKGEQSGSCVLVLGPLFAAGAVKFGPLEGTAAWITSLVMVFLDPGSLVIPIIMGLWKDRK
jgi:hypothetical protein